MSIIKIGKNNVTKFLKLRLIGGFSTTPVINHGEKETSRPKPESEKLKAFRAKLREKTPMGKLEELEGNHPAQEKEPLQPWPDNTNPHTGEIGGPRGPEPTRYGDWERKGRVSDF